IINAYSGHQILTAEIMPSRGFQSSVDYKTIIGLGNIQSLDSLEIVWPGFGKTIITTPGIDTFLVIHQTTGIESKTPVRVVGNTSLMKEEPNSFLPHVEDDFVDFYSEGLLMHKLSNEGPAYVRGDINGDHIDDIIIGGAAEQATMVYDGTATGWNLIKNTGLENEANFEDVVAVLCDLDKDGDSDLVIGSGGNHDLPESRTMQDRVYINDGSGHFKLSSNALPPNGYNTSAIGIDDVDLDGDPDLIICSRSIPGNYGPSPPSYVYVNDGKGLFKIATDEIAPALKYAGLLTHIVVANVAGDTRPEWIITREWDAPIIFGFQNGHYEPITTNLSDYPGWWFTVAAADLDQDGKMDLILGNIGENFYFSGQSVDQYKLWISDIDQNGTVENIITRSVHGKDVPVPMKKELTEQMPFLKKLNLKHKDYAGKSLQDLIPAPQLEKALVRNSSYHSTIVAWNKGDGQFDIERLPMEVQLSCVSAIAVHDINYDGQPDLILGGNDYGFLPQFSRLDASTGFILLNNGRNKWHIMDRHESGWIVKGEIKSIDLFPFHGRELVLSIRDNDKPSLFSFDQKVEF
ncbi:MAG: FG-GAP-like repeat-containing protein, partial [Saprospiraceae bacterium]